VRRRSPHHGRTVTQAFEILTFYFIGSAGPVLADLRTQFHCERPALVFSVTSDLAASLSVQTAPQRPARPDPSQSSESFGALVDSNTAVDVGSDPAPLPAPDRPAPQRLADDVSANTDNRPSRNAAPSDQAAPQKGSGDGGASTDPAPGSKSAADSNGKAEASQPPGSMASSKSVGKSGTTQAQTSKAASKDSSDGASSPDPSAANQQDGAIAVTTAIAVAIPVTVAPADAGVAAPASANSAPLAIAAAAIAASSSAAAAPGAASTLPKDGSAATFGTVASGTTTAAALVTGIAVDGAVTGKAAIQGASGDAVATLAKLTATSGNATAANNPSLPALVEAAAPAAPKTILTKGSVAAEAKATSPASDTPSDLSDKPATPTSTTPTSAIPSLNNAAPPPAATAKPEAANDLSDAAKANISDGASLSISTTGRDRSAAASSGQTPAASSEASLQATATPLPQTPSTPTGAVSTASLSVTAPTSAAVPVSGLAVEIAASVKSVKTRFEIRLDPADLGRIDVRIDVDRNGQVTSHLTVEKPETLSMLQQDAPQLQRALDDAGLKTGSGGLQFSLRDQSSSGQNGGNQTTGNAQRLVISDDDAIPAAVAGRSYSRMPSASGGVDIRV
jgi:flagellar hook-length control protein FliK